MKITGPSRIADRPKAALAFGLAVFAVETGRLTPIHSLDEARNIKTNRSKGYNFVAVSPEYAGLLQDPQALPVRREERELAARRP